MMMAVRVDRTVEVVNSNVEGSIATVVAEEGATYEIEVGTETTLAIGITGVEAGTEGAGTALEEPEHWLR